MEIEVRSYLEDREKKFLSSHACLSSRSRGREKDQSPCHMRTCFQHDRDKILHCKSFRRLKHKTQVFLSPEGDHYRTRLTHTLEVSQIARTVARALFLNEDLTEAIALGHDLGHTPFGHAGEKVLDELVPGGFHHVRQSLRVVAKLEKDGRGLNLTWEVRDGILNHSKGQGPIVPEDESQMANTLEGRIVRLADVVAYVNHDLDDAIRAGLISPDAVPSRLSRMLGDTHSRRINTMVNDVITCSRAVESSSVRMSADVFDAITDLRDWLFHHVYRTAPVDEEFAKASHILRELYDYFVARPEKMIEVGGQRFRNDPVEISVADFVAGMTDRYAMNLYQDLFLPRPWRTL